MELSDYFKSIIDGDRCPVVICNLKHEIIYMNPAAVERYAKRCGAGLVGSSLLDCHGPGSAGMIQRAADWFGRSRANNIIYTSRIERENKDVYMVALRDGDGRLIGYYEKHEHRNPEIMRRYDFGDSQNMEWSEDYL